MAFGRAGVEVETTPRSELAGLTILHLDKDFEIIANITGQPLERLNIS
jgi:hypothetical protein